MLAAAHAQDIAALHCDRLIKCGAISASLRQICEERIFAVSGFDRAALEDGRLRFDPVKAHQCLDTYSPGICHDVTPRCSGFVFAPRPNPSPQPSCESGFRLSTHGEHECGTCERLLLSGEDCSVRFDLCAPGFSCGSATDGARYCERTDERLGFAEACTPGFSACFQGLSCELDESGRYRCREPRVLPADADCSNRFDPCAAGLFCLPTTSSAVVCRAPRALAEGEGCATGPDYCGQHLRCEPDALGALFCRTSTLLVEGDACTDRPSACSAGLACAGVDGGKRCVSLSAFDDGRACNPADHQCASGRCLPHLDGGGSRCGGRFEGEPCEAGTCNGWLRCHEGICTSSIALDGGCLGRETSRVCPEAFPYCRDGLCRVRPRFALDAGSECDRSEECVPAAFCSYEGRTGRDDYGYFLGRCEPLRDAGQPCYQYPEIISFGSPTIYPLFDSRNACLPGLFCTGRWDTCGPLSPAPILGAPCPIGGTEAWTGWSCRAAAGTTKLTLQADGRSPANFTCPAEFAASYVDGTWRCALLGRASKPIGAYCENDGECSTNWCTTTYVSVKRCLPKRCE